MAKPIPRMSPEKIRQVVELAWVDRPPYPRVLFEHCLGPGELTALMKRELTSSAYKLWSARDKGAKRPTVKSTFPFGR